MTADSDAPSPQNLPIRSLSRRLQYLVPAAALLFSGAQGLLGHADGLALSLALLEIAFGALLIRSLLRPSARAGSGDQVALLAAGVLGFEVLERWYTTGLFARSTALLAVVTLVFGLAGRRSPGLTPVLSAGTLETEGESK